MVFRGIHLKEGRLVFFLFIFRSIRFSLLKPPTCIRPSVRSEGQPRLPPLFAKDMEAAISSGGQQNLPFLPRRAPIQAIDSFQSDEIPKRAVFPPTFFFFCVSRYSQSKCALGFPQPPSVCRGKCSGPPPFQRSQKPFPAELVLEEISTCCGDHSSTPSPFSEDVDRLPD